MIVTPKAVICKLGDRVELCAVEIRKDGSIQWALPPQWTEVQTSDIFIQEHVCAAADPAHDAVRKQGP